MNIVFWVPVVLVVLYIVYGVFCLAINYHIASKIGISLVIVPASPENPLWLLLGNRIVSIIEYVFGESHFTRFSVRGWVYYDKYRATLEFGDHFAFVTPDKIWVFICDAQTLDGVIRRYQDFPRPLEVLGEWNYRPTAVSAD